MHIYAYSCILPHIIHLYITSLYLSYIYPIHTVIPKYINDITPVQNNPIIFIVKVTKRLTITDCPSLLSLLRLPQ